MGGDGHAEAAHKIFFDAEVRLESEVICVEVIIRGGGVCDVWLVDEMKPIPPEG